MTIIGVPNIDQEFNKQVIQEIIALRGRPVILYSVNEFTSCSVCSGGDPFCPECNGTNRVQTVEETTVTGIIYWKNAEQIMYRPEGKYVDGDCRIVVTCDDVGSGVSSLDTLLRSVTKMLVDGRYMIVDSYYRKGHPVNRMNIIAVEDEVRYE